jgi:hypothetical protein
MMQPSPGVFSKKEQSLRLTQRSHSSLSHISSQGSGEAKIGQIAIKNKNKSALDKIRK